MKVIRSRSPTVSQRFVVLGAAILVGAIVLSIGVVVVITRINPDPYGAPLDVDPRSDLAVAIAGEKPKRDASDMALLESIAAEPTSVWIAGPTEGVAARVSDAVAGAVKRETVAALVAYNIPGRDCGSYSAADEQVDSGDYRAWVRDFTAGLGDSKSIIVVEPDALAQLECLDASGQQERLTLLRYAVKSFAAQGSFVYLDAGHSGWHTAADMADLLDRAGVAWATGFSLNVANFRPTSEETTYGEAIADELPSPAHFVIDTSRNGVDPTDREWCNPAGRALGDKPTTDTASDLVDAYLWIKTPGLSDGACNGGPAAGVWWPEYALQLAQNAVSGS